MDQLLESEVRPFAIENLSKDIVCQDIEVIFFQLLLLSLRRLWFYGWFVGNRCHHVYSCDGRRPILSHLLSVWIETVLDQTNRRLRVYMSMAICSIFLGTSSTSCLWSTVCTRRILDLMYVRLHVKNDRSANIRICLLLCRLRNAYECHHLLIHGHPCHCHQIRWVCLKGDVK